MKRFTVSLSAVLALLCAAAPPTGALPDGREHELVSVGEQDNLGDVFYGVGVTDDGNGVRFGTMAARPDAVSAQLTVHDIAKRGPAGWQVFDANAPLLEQQAGQPSSATVLDASKDQSVVVLRTFARLHPDDVDDSSEDIYRYDVNTGQLDFVSGGFDNGYGGFNHNYLGGNDDLTKIVFRTDNLVLVEGAPPTSIYEWSDGSLEVVSRMPDGTYSDGSVNAPDAYPHEPSGLIPVGWGGALAHGGAHAVSDDASRVFWRPDPSGPLLATDDAETAWVVSASKRTGSVGQPASATFIAASHDGSLVYFLSNEQLTDEATAGGGIYRYSIAADSLELITEPIADAFEIDYGIASDDMSHVYFASRRALADGAVDTTGDNGDRNVYVWDGTGTRFVGRFDPSARTLRTTRDGRFLVIESTASVAGAQLDGHQGIYRYDSQADELVCASCRPDGSPSQGDARIVTDQFTSTPTPEFFAAPRGLSDDGRVFFTTSDRLAPADFSAVKDAYQYGAAGPALLSSGQSEGDSYVQDNSDDGRDVFFTTDATLVPEDTDGGLTDLYDARVGGGFPVPPTPRECADDECQGPLRSAPDASVPGTTGGADGAPTRPTLRVAIARVGLAARMRFARTGRLRMTLRVNRAGTLRVAVNGRLGGSFKRLAVRRVIARRGTVRVTVTLTPRARRALRRTGRLPLTVSARLGGGPAARLQFTLKHVER